MDSSGLMVKQAQVLRALNPNTKFFVYRNLVKASYGCHETLCTVDSQFRVTLTADRWVTGTALDIMCSREA